MNKKHTLLIVLCLLSSSVASAHPRCGLGSKLFGKSHKIISQSTEVTSNPTFSNGSSMTYGTSGCKHDGNYINPTIGMTEKEMLYINANFDELVVEMAEGKGEVLAGFAQTLGCDQNVTADFLSMTRARYTELIPNESTTPTQMLENVKVQLKSDARLDKGCKAFVI